jgi:protein PhnA
MSLEKKLKARSHSACELCGANENLQVHIVAPKSGENVYDCAMVCGACATQIENPETIDANHWRCLNDSMWNTEPAVQVVAWRMLHQLTEKGADWTQPLLDMMYMDDETAAWAKELAEAQADALVHVDSNGVILEPGDTVVLIQDLNVKGANFTAKRGTSVRRISLNRDNAEHVEGKINGQSIVILTKYVKKSK